MLLQVDGGMAGPLPVAAGAQLTPERRNDKAGNAGFVVLGVHHRAGRPDFQALRGTAFIGLALG
jgi:hypothetical protein